MSRLWKNWPVHNLIAHPLSEIVYWLTRWFVGSTYSDWIHDVTVPEHDYRMGRG